MANKKKLLCLIIAFATITFLMCCAVYYVHPFLHVDELFHVRQVQKYCNFRFTEWDPKITTPPGLYIYSLFFTIPGAVLFGRSICNLFFLRLINVFTIVLHLCNMYSVLRFLNKNKKNHASNSAVLWTSWNICILPPLYFWSSFYYTEVLSTFLVFVMYNFHIRGRYFVASFFGFCCLLVRQTNIIWVGFFLLNIFCNLMLSILEKRRLRPRISVNFLRRALHASRGQRDIIKKTLKSTSGYIVLCHLFLIFIVINRGIVLGDRSAHAAAIHIPQIFYFSFFSVFFSLPHTFSFLHAFITKCVHSLVRTTIALIAIMIILRYNSLIHPYLLADNRHITFYLWKRLLGNENYHILLAPIYLFGIFFITSSMKNTQPLFISSFWICVIAQIVPQTLLELRYFIIPFVFFRVHMSTLPKWQLIVENIFYSSINLFVLYLFMSKTLYWSDFTYAQRLGW